MRRATRRRHCAARGPVARVLHRPLQLRCRRQRPVSGASCRRHGGLARVASVSACFVSETRRTLGVASVPVPRCEPPGLRSKVALPPSLVLRSATTGTLGVLRFPCARPAHRRSRKRVRFEGIVERGGRSAFSADGGDTSVQPTARRRQRRSAPEDRKACRAQSDRPSLPHPADRVAADSPPEG